jgi:hypothetical protein
MIFLEGTIHGSLMGQKYIFLKTFMSPKFQEVPA